MPDRILLADDSPPLAAAIRRALAPLGREIEVVAPGQAAARACSGRFGVAFVRRTAGAQVVAAIRAADPLLPIVLLVPEGEDGGARAGVRGDALLVGPFAASAVCAACTLAEELRARAERIVALEERLARPPRVDRELEFLKKLLFVEVRRSRRYGYPLSLALVAVDGWERLARKLPARSRAALLAGVLGAISGSLRDIDLAVPFSEGRLVVLMPHTDPDGALRVARRVCALVRDRAGTPRVTVSAGVAAHAGDRPVSFGGLVKRAAEALARARAAGGDGAEPADPPKKRDRISIG